MPWTKEQEREYGRQYYLAHREHLKALHRARYLKNKAKVLAQTKAYREAHPEVGRKAYLKYRLNNPEKCRAANRRWRLRNLEAQRERERTKNAREFAADPDKIRQRNRRWSAANRATIAARDLRRKARKANAPLGDPVVIKQWMEEVRSKPFVRCHWCGTKVKGSQVHFDHVIAISNGGSHSIGNLCSSCVECNCSKQARSPAHWDKHDQIFLHL